MSVESATGTDEDTSEWALYSPGFMGTIKQLTHCGRCGKLPPHKRYDEPRRYGDVFKPTMHFICDACYEALP